MALLKAKTVLVTGAGRGLGAGIALELARHGANLIVNYRTSGREAEALVEEIQDTPGAAIAVRADVEDERQARRLVAAAEERFGFVDVLVNNAYPGYRGGDILDVSWPTYRDSMTRIVGAAIQPIKAVLPAMRERRKGSIINIGTTSLIGMNRNQSPYVAGKGALLSLTHVLAQDLGPDNIRVNMVSPGSSWTDRHRPCPPDLGQDRVERTPMGRLPTAAEVGGAVVFYASDLSGFVTGTHLPVAGGMAIVAA